MSPRKQEHDSQQHKGSGTTEWREMIFGVRRSKISSVTDSRGIKYVQEKFRQIFIDDL